MAERKAQKIGVTGAQRIWEFIRVVACTLSLAPAIEALAQDSENPAPNPDAPRSPDTSISPASDAPVADEPQTIDQSRTGYAPQSGGTPMPSSGEGGGDELSFEVGGGMILFYYQPLRDGYRNVFELFEGRLRLDAKYGRFRMHLTPRFRNSRERDFFPGVSWVEEAYLAAEFGPTILKVGKIYRQFGRFWDNSFMGNVQEYDGLKLDMNHGLSYEGALREQERFGLGFALQYFLVDGVTNYSLPGRDTLSLPGARRRNQVVGRVEPFFKISPRMTAKLGVSGEYLQADIPEPVGKQHVARTAVDATFNFDKLFVWAEFTQQWGRHTTDFPFPSRPATENMAAVPGRSSDRVSYVLAGGEYTYSLFTVRYNYSMGDYREVGLKEKRHVPGFSVTLNPYLMALLEWSYVLHRTDERVRVIDSALVLTLHAKF